MPADLGNGGAPGAPIAVRVRPARDAPSDRLTELAHELRAELLHRGEFLPSSWIEEAAADLRSGRLPGWVVDTGGPAAGVAFFSPRPGRAYGHAHVAPGPDAVDRMRPLLDALRNGRPASSGRLDVGLTGLTGAQEDAVRSELDGVEGVTSILRFALEAPVGPSPTPPGPAPGRHLPVRALSVEALASLDWAAFQGTPDESLAADAPADDARVLDEILRGILGRFLDEASTVLVAEDGTVLGFLLTAEQSAHRGIFLDLVVDPTARRRGVGTYLLRWGIRALAALGHETVRLWVSEANAPARALYAREGLAPVGRALLLRFYGPGAPGAAAHPQTAP